MKDTRLEALLLGARPHAHGQYSELTQAVMAQLKQANVFGQQIDTNKPPKRNLLIKLRALHGGSLIAAILLVVILLTGVAYASVRFVPDLIEVIDRKVNTNGRLEYTAPAFANCYTLGQPELDTFEVTPSAGLSDDDVEKTLRAKCELMGMDTFASDTWPTYGENKEWKSGDTIFYTRPDRIGKVKSVTEHGLVLEHSDGGQPTEYKTYENKPLAVYSRGQQAALDSLKPGDLVFSMVRVSEVYSTPDSVQSTRPIDAHPQVRGIVAVVKLTLPERYYYEMQRYVQEVYPCEGNAGERCLRGLGGPSIDIFPREGGEGAANLQARHPMATGDQVLRVITGTISVIREDRFIITSSKGTQYTVYAPRSLLDDYNSAYAPRYVPSLTQDISKVRVENGSWVSVLYAQKPKADRKAIHMPDIAKLMLFTDAPAKGSKR